MDYISLIGIIGAIASIFGAFISLYQSKEAKKSKDASLAAQEATEKAKNKFLQNIQYEGFTTFGRECDKFCRFLQNASTGKNAQGKKENYVENALESFLTLFNSLISNTSGQSRKDLEIEYEKLKSMRESLITNDKVSILKLLDEMRILLRKVGEIQILNKLNM